MKCILLCAGYATRMFPLTENFPKSLLKVKGKPIIDYLIEDLESEGRISEYVVVSNHKFIDIFNDWKKTRSENIVVLDDGSTSNETRLGAVRDIYFAIDKLGIDEDVLVLAGDNLLSFSFNKFIDFYNEKKKSCIMTYYEEDYEVLKACGVIEMNEDNKVISFVEKPHTPKTHYCVPPFYIYRKEDLYLFKVGLEGECKVDAPGHYVEWVSKRIDVYAYIMPSKRIDIGTLEDYNKYKDGW